MSCHLLRTPCSSSILPAKVLQAHIAVDCLMTCCQVYPPGPRVCTTGRPLGAAERLCRQGSIWHRVQVFSSETCSSSFYEFRSRAFGRVFIILPLRNLIWSHFRAGRRSLEDLGTRIARTCRATPVRVFAPIIGVALVLELPFPPSEPPFLVSSPGVGRASSAQFPSFSAQPSPWLLRCLPGVPQHFCATYLTRLL